MIKSQGGYQKNAREEKAVVTENTRNSVWQSMLDVNRLVRYYEAISDQYRLANTIIRFIVFFGGTAGFISFLSLAPENFKSLVQGIFSAVVAAAVAWDFLADYAKKAVVLQQISMECSKLQNDWQELWDSIEAFDIEEEEARKRNAQLAHKIVDVTGRAGECGVRENPKINEKCADDTYKVMVERYAR